MKTWTSFVGIVVITLLAVATANAATQTLSAGDTLNLSITPADTNLTFQWTQNGTNLPDATNATLVVTNVVRANAGTYSAVITGDAVTNSDPEFVNVIDPVITNQPAGGNAQMGAKFTLAVGAAGTPVPGYATGLHYQWYFQRFGGPAPGLLAGRTNAALKFTTVSVTNAGSYFCVVTNRFLPGEIVTPNGNVVTSAVVTLTTFYPPLVQVQPANQVRTAGNNASFLSLVYSTAPLTFQWSLNGIAIPGATKSSYTRLNVQAADAGTYMCSVTNALGANTHTSIANGHLKVNADAATPVSIITTPAMAMIVTNGTTRSLGTNISTVPDIIFAGRAVDDGLITNITLLRTFPPWAPITQWDVTPTGQLPNKQGWTNVVTLVDGTNTFMATATDNTGKTGQSRPRIIFLRDRVALTVNVNGGGKAVPAGTVYFGAAKNGALLDVNRNYGIKALPNAGVNFVNWTDGLGTVLTTLPTLQFTMTNGLVLNANFDH